MAMESYSFGGALGAGWAVFKRRYPLLLAVTLVNLVILAAISAFGLWMERLIGFNLVNLGAAFFVTPQLSAGLVVLAAGMARGPAGDFEEMFSGFRRVLMIAGIQFFLFLAGLGLLTPGLIMTAVIVGFGGGGGVGLVMIGAVLIVSIVVVMFVMVRFSLAQPLAVDALVEDMDLFAHLRMSWTLTERVWPSLIGLGIVLGVLIAVCSLLLVLPAIFFAAPLVLAVYGAAYAMLASPLTNRRIVDGACPYCQYDLSGHGDSVVQCPECGGVLDAV